MDYEMEELIPIVGSLAAKYTAFESTSVTYEMAEQLMEAVLYCIHETGMSENCCAVLTGAVSAEQAYELGVGYVEKKTKRALDLYHEILPEFVYYGNQCLYDTVIKGLPEFFKWYDVRFDPQNTILTLDYPVLRDLSGYTGVDRIYEYIRCICLEQRFLKKFSESCIISILSEYDPFYQSMIDNLCEIVLAAVAGHILADKHAIPVFLEKYCGNDRELSAYLAGAVQNITVRQEQNRNLMI